jgi:hypothetical protein
LTNYPLLPASTTAEEALRFCERSSLTKKNGSDLLAEKMRTFHRKMVLSGIASPRELKLVDATKITTEDKCKNIMEHSLVHYNEKIVQLTVNKFIAEIFT